MSISVTSKARIIASLTVGGFIAIVLLAVGCKGDYGVIEEERVSFETTTFSEVTPTVVNETPAVITVEATRLEPVIEPINDLAIEVRANVDTTRKVLYKDAEAAFMARNYEEAVDLFTHYTRRKNKNAWGFYMLGLSAKRAGNLDLAAEALETATDLDPRHVKSWTNLGRVYLDSSQPAKASQALEEAVMIDPAAKDAYRLKGRAYHQQGELTKAENAYRQALVGNDQDAWAMNNLAYVLIAQNKFDDALPLLALAIKINDKHAVFYNNLGMVLENKGFYRQAEEAYEKAATLDMSYEKASINRDRVAQVAEDRGVRPVDLVALAQELEGEIKNWKPTIAAEGE